MKPEELLKENEALRAELATLREAPRYERVYDYPWSELRYGDLTLYVSDGGTRLEMAGYSFVLPDGYAVCQKVNEETP